MEKLLLALFFIINFNLYASEIVVVGLDDKGNELKQIMSQKQYKKILEYELEQVDSVLKDSQKMDPPLRSGLQLKTIIVGLGMSGKIQFGPFQIGAAVHHRLFYDYVAN